MPRRISATLVRLLAPHLPAGLVRRLGRLQWIGPFWERLSRSATEDLVRRDLTIVRGGGEGLRFNAFGTNPGYVLGTTEPLIQELVARIPPGSVFYDIGAGVGFYTVMAARRVGESGVVVAFEPYPPNVRALRHNVALNELTNVTVVPKAVLATAGVVKLDAPESGEAFLRTKLLDGDAEPAGSAESVSVDDLLRAGELPLPTFVKIDVEGAEVAVVEGMREALLAHRPILLCELHGTNARFAELMTELGYRMTVVEGFENVADAPWWVHVLAAPVR